MRKPEPKTPAPKYVSASCESCEFYDYDEDEDAYVCIVDLDQDDMQRFLAGQTFHCPYYRYYDEYKSVHKQL
ncbi:MAG: hypothetical protein IKS35_05065 [Clostridia bacterium]|nr:hypothetical protein [Clostridia bacterium]